MPAPERSLLLLLLLPHCRMRQMSRHHLGQSWTRKDRPQKRQSPPWRRQAVHRHQRPMILQMHQIPRPRYSLIPATMARKGRALAQWEHSSNLANRDLGLLSLKEGPVVLGGNKGLAKQQRKKGVVAISTNTCAYRLRSCGLYCDTGEARRLLLLRSRVRKRVVGKTTCG